MVVPWENLPTSTSKIEFSQKEHNTFSPLSKKSAKEKGSEK